MASKIKSIDSVDPPKDAPDTQGKLKPGPGIESFKLAGFWKGQVEQVDKASQRWTARGNVVLRRFRDERNKLNEEGQRKMNLLWANIKVMKPAIYSKCPIPVVDRKFLDHDPIGRLSSVILERSLRNEQENNFHSNVTRAVYDRLLPGRGVVWVRYEPEFGESTSIPSMNPTGIEDDLVRIGKETGDKALVEETNEEERLEETGSTVMGEKVVYDYVDWKDYYLFPAKARTMDEIQAIGKKTYISRKEAKERFGEKIGTALQPDTTLLADTSQKSTGYSDTAIFRDINERSIVIFEIWNKSDKRVYWVSPGYEYLCDVMDDPLELTGFFPARCISATLTNDSLIPVPDYWEWQDQAIQIDELTTRIASLTKACKIAGVYNAAEPAINRILNESVENKLIPVDQWAMFAEKGGLQGVIDFLPLEEIQNCIKTLQEVRQQCMQDLDQVTGLSDIVRGTSDSRETLGGIRLKNNNAGTRLSEAQEDIAVFCRELIRLSAEIMCKHFSDETLIQSSGILYEEELQPDVVMRDYQAQQDMASLIQQPQTSPQPGQQPGAAQQPPGMQRPGQPPMPPNAMPPMHPPGGPPPPGAPPSNVVPMRPGMPAQLGMQPGQGQAMQPPAPQMPQQPSPPPPDPQVLIMMKVKKALKLLRDEVNRGYRIDIEVDSTIFGDRVQERDDATEFIAAVGQFMTSMQEVGTTLPAAAPLLAKILQWGVRKYRTGRDLEAEVDNFAIAMQKMAKQAALNPQQNPEAQKAQVEIQKAQMDMQNEKQKNQMETQRSQQDYHLKFQADQAKASHEQQKMQSEQQIERERQDMERQKMMLEMELAKLEHQMKMQEMQGKLHMQHQKMQMDAQGMQMDAHMQAQEHQMGMQQSHQQHQQTMQQGEVQHQHTMQQGQQEHSMAQKSHKMEQESLVNKAKHEKASHGLKMDAMKAKAAQPKPKKVAKK